MPQERFSLVNPTRSTHGRPSLPGSLPDWRIRDFNPSSKAWAVCGRGRLGATCRKQEVKRESPAAANFDHFFELRGAF